ncbi:hypothetical protein JCM10212_004943 [Sporobolomyces blumeae]
MLLSASVALTLASALAAASPLVQFNSDTSSASTSGGFTSQHWKDGIKKARQIVDQLTYEEKLNFTSLRLPAVCSGNTFDLPERFGIGSICFSDSPVGILSRYSSQFPGEVTAAATWDTDMIYDRAKAMGKEFHDVGINTPLAIVVGPIGRSVYGGRNWEGFSPDPYFQGEAVRETVRGMQEQGVTGLVKHFYGNEQEYLRIGNSDGSYLDSNESLIISSDIDDATAHELYVYPFAEAVREGAGAIMCSYQRLNGTLACENEYSLKTILKGELGFEGYVLSDWNAAWNTIPAAQSGLDFVEGTNVTQAPFEADKIDAAIQNGSLPNDILDDKIVRVLTPYFALNQSSLPEVDFSRSVVCDEHSELIRNISAHSITLLKNNQTLNSTFGLPIREKGLRDIILVGSSATYGPYGTVSNEVPSILYFTLPPTTPYTGQITGGFGSGGVWAPYVSTYVEGITTRARKASPPIFVDGYYSDNATAGAENIGLGETYFLDSRLQYAGKTIVFVSAVAMESADRPNLDLLNGGNELIEYVADRFNDTIVVINAPGPVNMPWISHPNVTSVVFGYFPGQEAGNALADVLFGDVNPSGKLPFTIAKNETDYDKNIYTGPRVPGVQENFTEGVFIDYKWFDAKNTTPLFEYGYGMSYTTFKMSNLYAKATAKAGRTAVSETNEKFYKDGKACDGLYDISHTVTATVKNTGKVAGAEVAQLYLTYPSSTPNKMPVRSLKGFKKPFLQPGESQTVSFELRNKDLAVWDVTKQGWVLPKGKFEVSVGSSSRKLPLKTSFTV